MCISAEFREVDSVRQVAETNYETTIDIDSGAVVCRI